MANMKPRAELAQSAPMARTLAMSKALTILPLAPSLILSRRFRPTRVLCTNSRPSRSGTPMWSVNSTGRGAGAAFLAVDHDEVREDAGFQHGLGDAHELPRVAQAELEAHRLAAGQFAQLGDELHQFDGRGERAVA